jgi:hypothetical protein
MVNAFYVLLPQEYENILSFRKIIILPFPFRSEIIELTWYGVK